MSVGSDVKFHEAEEDLGSYRAFSGLALTAFVLGLASALALVGPLLWCVPVFAGVVSYLAVRSIDRNPDLLTGRWLALTGLALAAFFGVAAPARTVTRNWMIEQRALEFADAWLGYIAAGDQYRAHQLMKTIGQRLSLDDRLQQTYETEEMQTSLKEQLLSSPATRRLLELGDDAQVRHFDAAVFQDSQKDSVRLKYEVTSDGKESVRPFTLILFLERNVGTIANEQWTIVSVQSDPVSP